MKKITLKRNNVGGVQLSREQMKKVLGGNGTSTTGPMVPWDPTSDNTSSDPFYDDYCSQVGMVACYCPTSAGLVFSGCVNYNCVC